MSGRRPSRSRTPSAPSPRTPPRARTPSNPSVRTPSRARTPSNQNSPADDTEPLNAAGGGAFFTADHNAWLERRNNWLPGTVLDTYGQNAELVNVARRIVRAIPVGPPPGYNNTPPPTYIRWPLGGGGGAAAPHAGGLPPAGIRDILRNAGVLRNDPPAAPPAARTPSGSRSDSEDSDDSLQATVDMIERVGGWEVFAPAYRATQTDQMAQRNAARPVPLSAMRQAEYDQLVQNMLDQQMETFHQAWLARPRQNSPNGRTAAAAAPGPDRVSEGRITRASSRSSPGRGPAGRSSSALSQRPGGNLPRINNASSPRNSVQRQEDIDAETIALFGGYPRVPNRTSEGRISRPTSRISPQRPVAGLPFTAVPQRPPPGGSPPRGREGRLRAILRRVREGRSRATLRDRNPQRDNQQGDNQ